jgi:acyl-CoA thioester hydrolase
MSSNSDYFELAMSVRDYELDSQGIVNNAVYLNYLEHCRHEYLLSLGLDFTEMNRSGLNPVVIRAELDYKAALKSGDHFRVRLSAEREGRLRISFQQQILNSHQKVMISARITVVCLRNGRPVEEPELLKRMKLL